MDYGAALWQSYVNSDNFIQKVDEIISSKLKSTVKDKTKDFFDLDDEESEELLENLKKNIHEGRFKFVVLMDKLHEQLKDLIAFINENSNFAIFAVEVEYYEHEDQEIMIPKLYGAEIKSTSRQPSDREKWNERKFLEKALEQLGQTQSYIMLEKLYAYSKGNSDKLNWGTGTESGSFTFKIQNPQKESEWISLFTVWTGGQIRFRLANIRSHAGIEAAELFQKKLSFMPISKKWKQKDIESYGPANALDEAFPNDDTLNRFKSTILEFKDEIKQLKINE